MAVPGRRFQQNDLRCDLCDDNRPAVGYCLQCCECLCTACENAHKRSEASKLHEILPKKDIPPEIFDDRNTCGEHGNETFIYFCLKHQEPCCYKCLVSHKHKTCNLQPIDDIAKDFENSIEYEYIKASIKNTSNKLEHFGKECVKYHAKTDESIERSMRHVCNFHLNLQIPLLNTKEVMEHELQSHKDMNNSERDATSRFCTESCEELTKLGKLLEFLQKQKWTRRLMLTTKLASQKITNIERKLKETERQQLRYEPKLFSFEPNMNSYRMMPRRYTFGEINVKEELRGYAILRFFYILKALGNKVDRALNTHKNQILLLLCVLFGMLLGFHFSFVVYLQLSCYKNDECYRCLRYFRGDDDVGVRKLCCAYGNSTEFRCEEIINGTITNAKDLLKNFWYIHFSNDGGIAVGPPKWYT